MTPSSVFYYETSGSMIPTNLSMFSHQALALTNGGMRHVVSVAEVKASSFSGAGCRGGTRRIWCYLLNSFANHCWCGNLYAGIVGRCGCCVGRRIAAAPGSWNLETWHASPSPETSVLSTRVAS